MSVPRDWFFSDAPYAGGAERYLEYLLMALPPGDLGLLAVEREGLRGWLRERERQGVPVRRIAPGPRAVEWARFHHACRELRPRTLHCNLPGPYDSLLGLAPRVAQLAGVPRVVATEHLPTVGRVGKRWWVKRASVGAVDRAVCVCEAHVPAMLALGYRPEQVVAVRNGIPDPDPGGRFRPGERQPWPGGLRRQERGGLQLMQVGSLEPRKGVDVLLHAMSLLRSRCVDATLWLAGEGPAEPALRSLAGALGLEGRVIFAGSREDLPGLWGCADIALLASWREGLPLSLAEAAGCSRPIVATAVDGVVEVVEHLGNGLLVGAGDPHALAEAMASLAQDRARRAAMGARSRQLFEQRFGLARMQQETLALYGGGRS